MEVFEQRVEEAEGLEDVLDSLSPVYQLGIITAGERWVQERRLADFHLRHRFAAIEIVEAKDEAVFSSFCNQHGVDFARSWVVGDSYRSDVKPAISAGLHAVLLETPNWIEVESQSVDVTPNFVIKKLKDLPRVPGLL